MDLTDKVTQHEIILQNTIKALDSVSHNLSKNNEKLETLITVVSKQEVILEHLSSLDATAKEVTQNLNKKIDSINLKVSELDKIAHLNKVHIDNLNKQKWALVSLILTAVIGAVIKGVML